MKTRFFLLLFSLLFPLSVFAQQRYVVTTQELNVRTAPSANSKVVDKVRQGDVITVVSINNGWAKIVYKKQERYVSSKYLSKVVTNDTYTQNNNYDQKQDIIVLKNGHAILGKVIEVNRDDIIYQPEDNTSSSSINIAAVQCIRYANGAQKNFSSDSSGYSYENLNQNNTYSTIHQNDNQNNIPEMLGSIGVYYAADFDFIDKGTYGLNSNYLWPQKYWGITWSIGTNLGLVDSSNSSYVFAVGPLALYPINSSFYLISPLRFVGSTHTEKDKNGKDKDKFSWGIDLVPGVFLYKNKWSLQLGINIAWAEGSKKLGTGFMAGIGRDF